MTTLPESLQSIVSMFAASPKAFRLQALLDYSKQVPPLPEHLKDHPEKLERVHECQSPFFLYSELQDGKVNIYFDAPPEAPTVRGFAGILRAGLNGLTPEEILSVPEDFYQNMGLSELITPMRLRGMHAILYRLKNQVRELQKS